MDSLRIIAISLFAGMLTSCGFLTGPDPAEALSYEIESNAKKLTLSEAAEIEFKFTPSERKLMPTIRPDRLVMVEFLASGENSHQKGESTIAFNRWFSTTYHNRFIHVGKNYRKTKCLGDPFHFTLAKSRNGIELVGIR